MTGLMTPDRGAVHGSDTIAKVQRRLSKTYCKAPRRTVLLVVFGLVKVVVLLGWLLSRQRVGTGSSTPKQLPQAQVC